jgi:hypothetical protein
MMEEFTNISASQDKMSEGLRNIIRNDQAAFKKNYTLNKQLQSVVAGLEQIDKNFPDQFHNELQITGRELKWHDVTWKRINTTKRHASGVSDPGEAT